MNSCIRMKICKALELVGLSFMYKWYDALPEAGPVCT